MKRGPDPDALGLRRLVPERDRDFRFALEVTFNNREGQAVVRPVGIYHVRADHAELLDDTELMTEFGARVLEVARDGGRPLLAFDVRREEQALLTQCVSSSHEPSPQGYLLTANWYLVREDGLIQGGTNAGRAASRPLGVRP